MGDRYRQKEDDVVPATNAVIGSVVRANAGGPWMTVFGASGDLDCFVTTEQCGVSTITAPRECFVMRVTK